MPANILLLITDLQIGGTPTVVRELASRLHTSGISVQVACLDAWGPVATDVQNLGIKTTALEAKGSTDFSVVSRLIELIQLDAIEVVLSFLVHANTVAALASFRCERVRFLQSIQTTQRTPRWHWWVQRVAARRCEKVLVPSPSVAEMAMRLSHIEREKIEIIPNAIDLADYTGFENRESIQVTKIGFIGRLDPIKRVTDLVDAMTLLPGAFHLDIFGWGAEEQNINGQIARLNLKNRVTQRGPVDRPQTALNEIDLLVLPSSAEGFGLVLIEAMAARVPIVATDVSGIRDVIVNEKTGLLVKPHNPRALATAIQTVANDDAKRTTLIQTAYETIKQKFSWSTILPMYVKELTIKSD